MNRRPALIAGLMMFWAVGCGSRASLDSPGEHPRASLDTALLADFSDQTCGSPADLEVHLTNPTLTQHPTNTLEWSASLSAPFTLSGATSGSVPPGGTTTLTIHVDRVSTAHAGDLVSGTLHLTTNDPEHPTFDLPVRLRSRGAELVAPNLLDFGEIDAASAVPLGIKNVGNLPVELAFAPPKTPDFSVDGPSSVSLAPSTNGTLFYGFHPSKPGLIVEDLPINVKGAVCGSVPKSLQLRGRGFVGDARLSVTKLDFGLVDCGTQGAAQTVDLKNVGPAPFSFSTSFGAQGGSYTVTPSSGIVSAGGLVTLAVTPGPVTPPVDVLPNALGNTLSISTSIPKDPPHVVDLTQTPHGASMVLPPSTVLGRRATTRSFSDLSLSVSNIGNGDVVLLGTSEYPQIAGTFVAGAGPTATSPLVVVAADDVGITQTKPFVLRPADGFPLCKVQNGTATWRGFTYGAGPGSATPQLACVSGAPDVKVFCSGTNTLASPPPFPHATLPVGTFDVAWVRQGPLAIEVGEQGYCISWYCVVKVGSSTVTFEPAWTWNPSWMGAVGAGGPFQVCSAENGGDRIPMCIGLNSQGQWGDGGTSNTLVQSLMTVMGGVTGVVSMSTSAAAGYAVLGTGRILVAGTKSGGNFGTTSVPDGLVVNPVFVDGIFDATSVQAFPGGACAIRSNGAVSCWDTTHPIADRGGFTDAVEISASGRDDFCALRTGGVVSCWNGTSASVVPSAPDIATFIRGTGGAKLVTFQNGAAARIVNGTYVYLPGFEGP